MTEDDDIEVGKLTNVFQIIAIYITFLASIAIFYFLGFKWFTSFWSLIGVYINIRKIKYCFIIWAFTNFAWAVIDFKQGLPEQGTLFSIYFILAIYGLVKWHREGKCDL
jgi:hypothetical protein